MGSMQDEVEEFLIKNGSSTTIEISKNLDRPVTNIYMALQKLRKWGIAEIKRVDKLEDKCETIWSIK